MTYGSNRPASDSATERELERTADKAHDAVDAARDKAADLADQAQKVSAQVADQAQKVGAQVADKADAATTTVGEKMTDVAQTIRDKAPTSGPVADAADTAAETLERAGTYLREQDLSGIRADLEGIIRRHPIESLLIGLGVGYLLARSRRR
jgi:ABC-type transporter Mla subunit MlaD